MPLSVFFWILMLLWLVYGFWWGWSQPAPQRGGVIGGSILGFLLFLVLGLAQFGGPIKN